MRKGFNVKLPDLSELEKRFKVSDGKGFSVEMQEGVHNPSGLTYKDLMAIHSNGVPSKGIPSRPVFEVAHNLYGDEVAKKLITVVTKWMTSNKPINSLETELLKVGGFTQEQVQSVFGSMFLTVTSNPTPLMDTGELRRAVTHRLID